MVSRARRRRVMESPVSKRMDGTVHYIDDDDNSLEESKIIYYVGKKRGRPVQKGGRYWLDDEILTMIKYWSGKELLYNYRHVHYHDRERRAKAINDIRKSLEGEGITASNKHIQEKMINLRNYYAAERRKNEAAKKSGLAADSVYVSRWKFYNPLEFLQDNFISRRAANKLTPPNEEQPFLNVPVPEDTSPTYNIDNRPSPKVARKSSNPRKIIEENVLAFASQVPNCSINSKSDNEDSHLEDKCFTDLIFQMLKELPDSREKSMAKIEFQQKLLQLRYNAQRPLLQIPNFAGSQSTNSHQERHYNHDRTPLPATDSQCQGCLHRSQQSMHSSQVPSPMSGQSAPSLDRSQSKN